MWKSLLCVLIAAFLLKRSNSSDDSQVWSYFVFAQQWPPAACLNVPGGKCSIPKQVTEWSIHGLWPTSKKGYPSFCNSSWPFRPAALKPILQSLEAKWPNIYANTSEYSFWKHEWSKHGTCAASEELFDTELKYFKRSLELHDQYNIYEFIRKAGISPNKENPYMLSYIENAISLQVNKTVKFFCKSHKDYSSPVLTSMYICYSKKLELIDCDEIKEPTCDTTFVYYLPFPDRNFNERFIMAPLTNITDYSKYVNNTKQRFSPIRRKV